MTRTERYHAFGRDLLPVFLGSNVSAHRLSLSLFHQFGSVSLVADRHRTAWDVINPTSRFLSLPPSGDPRLTVELLEHLVSLQAPETLPLLIPCKEEYRRFVRENAQQLETRFIVVPAEELFSHAPLADLSR